MESTPTNLKQPKICNRPQLSSDIHPPTQTKECFVVVEDIFKSPSAVKLKTLEASPEKTHSATSRPADLKYLKFVSDKPSINWPSMDDDESWTNLDNAVFSILNHNKPIDKRISSLEKEIFDRSIELFGFQEHVRKDVSHKKQNRLFELVQLKNSLSAQVQNATCPVQSQGLLDLLIKCKSDLRVMRRNEKSRKKRWKAKRVREQFRLNPWKTGKLILRPVSRVSLSAPSVELDNHLSHLNSDPNHLVPLPPLEGLPEDPDVVLPFDPSRFKFNDFTKLLVSRRNSSRPGPNGIPYKVYKKCDMIARYIFSIFGKCLSKGIVPIMWRHAFISFIPKVENPKANVITDFRQIALLNVEGKLFFSLLSSRLTKHIVHKNKFIDLSVQKGCMEGIPGCWEHMAMLWDTLKESITNKNSVSTIWLDVANAYGSIPHQLIFLALKRYGLPDHWINIIRHYYGGLWSKANSKGAKSNWHQHMRGIFAGCTISIILFLAGFNVLIEYILLADVQAYITSSRTALPLVRAFMDDINLLSNSVVGTKTLLARCVIALKWARMGFRAHKSRSLVILDGKPVNDEYFRTDESPSTPSLSGVDSEFVIPSIHKLPIKFLGRKVDISLSDRLRVPELKEKLLDGLQRIDDSKQLGINKVWIMQNLLLHQIRWLLTIYEIPMTVAESLEKTLSKFIRKWLGLHQSTTSSGFYNKLAPCPLPLKSFTSILKASKVSAYLLLRDSKDPLVSSSVPRILTGQTWHVDEAVKFAESDLAFREKFGQTNLTGAGLGLKPRKPMPQRGTHDYRRLISDIVCEEDDKTRFAKAVQLEVQGQWTAWERYVQTNLSWKTIWALPSNLVSFCLGSTYNTLPSPSNLKRWCVQDSKLCTLCSKIGTVSHILSGCKYSLAGGRFTYRHDTVLILIYNSIKDFLPKIQHNTRGKNRKVVITDWVKAGSTPKKITSPPVGLLNQANDWKILVDLQSLLIFPVHIAKPPKGDRPDIIIFCNSLKIIIIIELTFPCEENFDNQHHRKTTKYQPLCDLIEEHGWICHFFAVEVGARGYCAKSVLSCFKRLGFPLKRSRQLMRDFALQAMKSSFKIWLMRDSFSWDVEPIQHPDANVSSPNPDVPVPPTSTATDKDGPNIGRPPVPTVVSPARRTHTTRPVGLTNLGNTCYEKRFLQARSQILRGSFGFCHVQVQWQNVHC